MRNVVFLIVLIIEDSTMYNIEEFFLAFSTLLHSWGGDTPSEATWAANEMIDWIVVEYEIDYEKRFDEDPSDDGENNSTIVEELKAILGPIGEARERELEEFKAWQNR